MAYGLNGIRRRSVVLDFVVFLVITTSIALIFCFLLLSAAMQIPNTLIQKFQFQRGLRDNLYEC